MEFSIGKQADSGAPAVPRRPSAILLVRLNLTDSTTGKRTFGCSGDRPSYGWLDKRPERSPDTKLRELLALVKRAREVVLENPEFDSPFSHWEKCYGAVLRFGRKQNHEDLSSSFASALFERAIVDAVCRLHGESFFDAVRADRLGFRPDAIHPELAGLDYPSILPARPRTQFHIRHTVGLSDPLTGGDLAAGDRANDGEPETLEEYIARDGLTYFKVKISGDSERDITRLARVWEVVSRANQPVITLDGNESYTDLEAFARFVITLDEREAGLFQHILFIEQPLTRALTLDPSTKSEIEKITRLKPLAIDEADGLVDSFSKARLIGYRGTSHKNCKGLYKSLANHALCHFYNQRNEDIFMSGEDLSNMPLVPLHQDFAVLGVLGLSHTERNGHHYSFGLSLLSAKEKALVAARHTGLYTKRGDEWFLNIRGGMVDCASLQCPGLGVAAPPDWESLRTLADWMAENLP